MFEEYWSGQEDLWREHGRKLLTAITHSTDMLVCAEDLGVVPQCVPEVLDALRILGLRVDRWSGIYGPSPSLEGLPKLTVVTTSTHDCSTLRGWWEEYGWNRDEYFTNLNLPGPCPEYLTTEVCAAILERNLNAGSLIVVLPLQDLFALHYDLRTMEPNDERINVPGVQSTDNWTYRMKVSIEALLAYDVFNDHLRELVVRRRERVPAAIADAARQ
jgi:4-alpha-glucanotransferase